MRQQRIQQGSSHHIGECHPLIAESGPAGVRASRSSPRSMTWRLPGTTGPSLFGSKEGMVPLISTESMQVPTVPHRGQKLSRRCQGRLQATLMNCIVMERSEKGCRSQNSWALEIVVYVLCSKRSVRWAYRLCLYCWAHRPASRIEIRFGFRGTSSCPFCLRGRRCESKSKLQTCILLLVFCWSILCCVLFFMFRGAARHLRINPSQLKLKTLPPENY
jgi:hypothetical protein